MSVRNLFSSSNALVRVQTIWSYDISAVVFFFMCIGSEGSSLMQDSVKFFQTKNKLACQITHLQGTVGQRVKPVYKLHFNVRVKGRQHLRRRE